ncbi:hypothetical protein [Lichenibacterium dinghuense]|uniref:hypothetical protein n=1 Tax=Lichenibacterium dinghuense TaxID=2895977 RepID=UPI001F382D9F|nr:hypothetical protein [Lichenibacterium sp. 6Y81]
MVTGRQIRAARELLGWDRADLSRQAFLPLSVIEVIEYQESASMLLDGQMLALRRTCERAGIEFAADGPRLKVNT